MSRLKYVFFLMILILISNSVRANYPTTSYQLSTDGLTLEKWFGAESVIDMSSDSKLSNVTTIGDDCFSEDSLLESISISNKVVVIGKFSFWRCVNLTTVNIPNSVTTIKYGAFIECVGLAEILIPNSVTTIEDWAFELCDKLESITLPSNLKVLSKGLFDWCINLKNIGFPSQLTEIGENAFNECHSLQNVILPETVTTLGKYSFYNCSNLSNFYFPKNLLTVNGNPFEGCSSLTNFTVSQLNSKYNALNGVLFDKSLKILILYPQGSSAEYTIPVGTEVIEISAFQGNTILKNIYFPTTLKQINSQAFTGCTSLSRIELPSSVISIADFVFGNCTNLKSVKLPTSLNRVENYCFANCTSLSDIVIPSSVSSIGWGVFVSCKSLKAITIPNSVISIDAVAFDGSGLEYINLPTSINIIKGGCFKNCPFLKEITIPTTVKTIENSAFFRCSSLQKISLPPDITEIQLQMFYDCKSLTEIDIPQSVKTIGENAFANCTSLKSIKLPSALTTISNWAFTNCSSVKQIYSNRYVPSTAGDSAFNKINIDSCTVYIPVGSKTNYQQTSPWNKFKYFVEVASDQVKNIVTTAPGTVPDLLTTAEKSTLSTLRVIGPIDARDFRLFTREMPALSTIDLSKATVKEYIGSSGTSYFFQGNVTYPANTIPTGSFYNKGSLQYIILPDSLRAIDSNLNDFTFGLCSNLKEITLPKKVNIIGEFSFWYCNGLEKLTLSDSLSNIGNHNFVSCQRLNYLFIPKTLNSIGEQSLYSCGAYYDVDPLNNFYSSIDGVLFDKSAKKLYRCGSTKTGVYTIPNGVESIEYSAFNGCNNLTKIIFSNSIRNIGSLAFYWCSSLKHMNIPIGVTNLNDGYFYKCSALKSIYVESLIPLSASLFYKDDIDYFSNVTLIVPNKMSQAYKNDNYWGNFKNVAELSINEKTVSCNVSLDQLPTLSEYININSIEYLNIEGSISTSDILSIQLNYINLKKLDISNTTLNADNILPENSLFGFNNLEEIILPNTLSAIQMFSMSNNKSLKKITIPASVKSIGSKAFAYDYQVSEIYSNTLVPIDLTNSVNVFEGVNKNSCVLYVPTGSKALYQAANQWKEFMNIIESGTALKPITSIAFKIFPNPATSYLTISSESNIKHVELCDISGRTIQDFTLNTTTYLLDLNKLTKGVYLLTAYTDSGMSVGRFVKQ